MMGTYSIATKGPFALRNWRMSISTLVWMIALLLFAATPALAQDDVQPTVPVLTPAAVISLDYPNRWDRNELIAFSPDGRYLIDAPGAARYIRVWDWRTKEVVKQLLLNEAAPEFNDDKSRSPVLNTVSRGRKLEFSTDGRYMAACTSGKGIWDFERGTAVTSAGGFLRNVPGIPGDAVVLHRCDSIGFSPDGTRFAIHASYGLYFPSSTDLVAYQDTMNRLDRRGPQLKLSPQDLDDMSKGQDKSFRGGVALYDTRDWRPVRYLRLAPFEKVNSHILFTADGTQALAMAYQYPPSFPENVRGKPEAELLITNQLVRWNLASGEIVARKELPKLAPGSVGVWWHWLTGGREVWWETTGVQLNQTGEEAQQCEPAMAAPAFVSEQAENCGYFWAVSVLDVETGKRRFLAPVKKSAPKKLDEIQRITGVIVNISPDGRRLALMKKIVWKAHGASGRDPHLESMVMELYDLTTGRLVGAISRGEEEQYSLGISNLRFSADSQFLAFRLNEKAFIFDLKAKRH